MPINPFSNTVATIPFIKPNPPVDGPKANPSEDAPVEVKAEKSELESLREYMSSVEQEFAGISNIPVHHRYYDVRQRIQELTQK